MIIARGEAKALKKIPKWVLVYGRRKTGKTFLVKNFIKYDEYFFVKRDRTVIVESSGSDISYEAFKELFVHLMRDNRVVVIDEFHRLGNDFMDFLHFTQKTGKLILISSTFHMALELVGAHSPLLGVVAEFPVGLLNVEDTIRALPSKLSKKEKVELALLMSEPLMIEYYQENITASELCTLFLSSAKYVVPALIGEIFTEEERQLSAVYEGILRAIATGKRISTEISSFLYSRQLIPKDNPGGIQPYLSNLMQFGLIRRIRVFNKKNMYVYEHISPLVELFYYGDEKYNLSEAPVHPPLIAPIVDVCMPHLIERSMRNLVAKKFDLMENVILERDYDVDGYLTKFKKGEIALEVKWKKTVDAKDIERAEQVLSRFPAKRRLLLVPDKNSISHRSSVLEIIDIEDLI